jgi:midasin
MFPRRRGLRMRRTQTREAMRTRKSSWVIWTRRILLPSTRNCGVMNKDKKDGGEQPADQEPPSNAEDEAAVGEEEHEDHPDASGAPMEDHIQDANTLDLPDDMDLGLGEEMADAMEMDEGPEDDAMDEDDGEPAADTEPSKEQPSRDEPPAEDAPMEGEDMEPPVQTADTAEEQESPEGEEAPEDHAVTRPDVTAGEGEVDPNNENNEDGGESAATGQAGSSAGVAGQDTAAEEKSKDEDGYVHYFLFDRS